MESFYINKRNYYNVATVRDNHPELFALKKKKATKNELMESLNCDENDFFIGIKSGDKYVESDSTKSICFVRTKVIDQKLEDFKANDNKDVVRKCPKKIKLKENECFVDSDGNNSEILTVGERNRDRCFFYFEDVVSFFDLCEKKKEIKDVMIHKNSSYKCKIHYAYFMYLGKREFFITFYGLLKMLFYYKSKDANSFCSWRSDILFTTKFGSKKEKLNMFINKMGVSVDALKQFLALSGPMPAAISGTYMFAIGTVKELRESLNIPDTYPDNDIVYKFGKTANLGRRAGEHDEDFSKLKGGKVALALFEIVDLDHLSKAETSLKNFFMAKKLHYPCTDSNGNNRTELVILNKKEKWAEVKAEFSRIGTNFANTTKGTELRNSFVVTQLNSALHQIQLLEAAILLAEEKHKRELSEKDYAHDKELAEEQRKSVEQKHAHDKELAEERHKSMELIHKCELMEERHKSAEERHKLTEERHKYEILSMKCDASKIKTKKKD